MQFTLQSTSSAKFAPRIGKVLLQRLSPSDLIPTPNLLTSTSRGVIPHLSRDHHNKTDAVRWVNIPFESFR
ncbi:hypothetical protein M378DRAFT_164128 [Amanita muscaria Koide BX008]|uniref:Uncharacterized protein n=1 Tax=Amanita muscaria (strain Koide BX008) TaxID=946122 RepID=A0A0C2TAH0_AMAMK|nr:hypothetical protein M378DRAFT_164128 [Amanita muscaria Koide BX008]